jgi:hypothetical protein
MVFFFLQTSHRPPTDPIRWAASAVILRGGVPVTQSEATQIAISHFFWTFYYGFYHAIESSHTLFSTYCLRTVHLQYIFHTAGLRTPRTHRPKVGWSIPYPRFSRPLLRFLAKTDFSLSLKLRTRPSIKLWGILFHSCVTNFRKSSSLSGPHSLTLRCK